MKKVAIISFFHYETSLCLAKYISKQGIKVDYYAIVDLLRDKGNVAGFEYAKAKKCLGLHLLTEQETPEIYSYTKGIDVKYYLLRVISYSNRLKLLSYLTLKSAMNKIKQIHYDAINIVGQHQWVEFIHDQLKNENIIHTLHEVGSHQDNIASSPLIDKLITDKSKIILQSKATAERFNSIAGSKNCQTCVIPFGKMETLLLYNKDVKLNLTLNINKPTFLFYGYLRPYKGLSLLAKAMNELKNEYDEFNLIIAGGGSDNNLSFFRTLPNCNVINRFLSNEEMMKLNKIATAILLPYKTASQSGIITNTFLYGKPIIGTKVGALLETIKDGQNGLLVEREDYKSFASAMRCIINDKKLYNHLCKGAINFGNGDAYDWNKIAKETIDFMTN